MKGKQKPGVIINMGSAAGLYPMSFDPIYSAAKGLLVCLLFLLICSPLYLFFSGYSISTGGVVLFTRSLAHLKRQGIRINVLCPEVSIISLMSLKMFCYALLSCLNM